jgi:hypothetical protein
MTETETPATVTNSLENTLRTHYSNSKGRWGFLRRAKQDIFDNLDYVAEEKGFTKIQTPSTKIKFYFKENLDGTKDLFVGNGQKSMYFDKVTENPDTLVGNIMNEMQDVGEDYTDATAYTWAIGTGAFISLMPSPFSLLGLGIYFLGATALLAGGAQLSDTQCDNYGLIRDKLKERLEDCKRTESIFALEKLASEYFSRPSLNVEPAQTTKPQAPETTSDETRTASEEPTQRETAPEVHAPQEIDREQRSRYELERVIERPREQEQPIELIAA